MTCLTLFKRAISSLFQFFYFKDNTVRAPNTSQFFREYFALLFRISLIEYKEIRLQVLAQSKSLKHLLSSFINMMETYRQLGMEPPKVFYTDNADAVETQEHLIRKNDPLANDETISLPTNVEVKTFSSATDIDNVCETILNDRIGDKEIFIGLDCEWVFLSGPTFSVTTRITKVPKGVALVQLS
ncbi:hypothetical protein K501DRAFT_332380 [Backusella circina FSU 941]|nr:hypothetical protein K501DRAFT_332380 [Backusella circina FSU 941]